MPKNNQNDMDELVCFCFKYSKKDILDAVKDNRDQHFIENLKNKMKNPGCFCETSNPSKKCCLADVSQYIIHLKK